MSRANASGYYLKGNDVPIVLGMIARGDRKHDIAAWFGVNQGRIADAENGKYGGGAAAPADKLPPKGPPGIKGRALRETVENVVERHVDGNIDVDTLLDRLITAIAKYDAPEA